MFTVDEKWSGAKHARRLECDIENALSQASTFRTITKHESFVALMLSTIAAALALTHGHDTLTQPTFYPDVFPLALRWKKKRTRRLQKKRRKMRQRSK
jgi:hypothetical protein